MAMQIFSFSGEYFTLPEYVGYCIIDCKNEQHTGIILIPQGSFLYYYFYSGIFVQYHRLCSSGYSLDL